MKVLVSVLLFALGCVVPVQPSVAAEPVLSSYRVRAQAPETVGLLASLFDVERHRGGELEVVLEPRNAERLLALIPDAELLEADLHAAVERDLHQSLFSGFGYHSFSEVQAMLQDWALRFPARARLIPYGQSQQGKPLLALKVARDAQVSGAKPALLITAATHGDELITVEVLLGLMQRLLEGYGQDPRMTAMIDGHEIYFVPVVNPDGFSSHMRWDNGRDPNRSYPWPNDPQAKSTASIEAIIRFFHTIRFAGSMDLHAYGELTMYPWAYTTSSVPAADAQVFDDLARRMAATNGYEPGPIATTIYVAQGSSADYYYWKQNTLAMAIEMGQQKIPSAETIPAHIEKMAESTWLFVEHFN